MDGKWHPDPHRQDWQKEIDAVMTEEAVLAAGPHRTRLLQRPDLAFQK